MRAQRIDVIKDIHRVYNFKQAVFNSTTCGWHETKAGVPYELDLEFTLDGKDYTLTIDKKEARALFYVLLNVLVG
jgi:hypothetical protein